MLNGENDNTPDCFDLNDWLLLEHPETHLALRYLNPDSQYRAMLTIWREKGCPEIR